MEGVDGLCGLESEPDSSAPIRRPGSRMKDVVEIAVAHELDDQEPVGRVGGEADQVDEPGVVELGEDLDLVVDLVGVVGEPGRGGVGGLLDGDEAAAAEHGLVDQAMAAFAEKLPFGEAIGGGLEVTVLELLDFDGGFGFAEMGFGRGIGIGDCDG